MRPISRRAVLAMAAISLSTLSACTDDAEENDGGCENALVEEPYEPSVFEHDELVDRFIVRYNELNPGFEITDPKPYEHHGRVHEDQAIFTQDGFEVTVTHGALDRIAVYIESFDGLKTNEEGREIFSRFAAAILPDDSPVDPTSIWDTTMSDEIRTAKFGDIEARITVGLSGSPFQNASIEGNVDL